MRHRFHSICPYFAMFPESFVEKHLAASPHDGVVFDPFCGRGTTVFQALLQGRAAGRLRSKPRSRLHLGGKGGRTRVFGGHNPPSRTPARVLRTPGPGLGWALRSVLRPLL